MSFERWMDAVDRVLEGMLGINTRDLADIEYWDLWNSGASPQEAADEALANEGYGGYE